MSKSTETWRRGLAAFTAASSGHFWLDFVSPWQARSLMQAGDSVSVRILMACADLLQRSETEGYKCLICDNDIGLGRPIVMFGIAHMGEFHPNNFQVPAIGMGFCPCCVPLSRDELMQRATVALREVWPDIRQTAEPHAAGHA